MSSKTMRTRSGTRKKNEENMRVMSEADVESSPSASDMKSQTQIGQGGHSDKSKPLQNIRLDSKSTPKKKLKKERTDSLSDDELKYERPMPTENGGFAHTTSSKKKIGRANRGRTPWNKGKTRSEATKAKISAGVRARNRAILLKKLEELGISEEEYEKRKKREKKQRGDLERKRKAEEMKKQRTKKEPKKRRGKRKHGKNGANVDSEVGQRQKGGEHAEIEEKKKSGTESIETEDMTTKGIPLLKEMERTPHEIDSENACKSFPVGGPQVVADIHLVREIEWTPHEFDSENACRSCPTGGPGGLVCCGPCTAAYSRFLCRTVRDMETQTLNKIGQESQEILDFLRDAHRRLREEIDLSHSNGVRRSFLGFRDFAASVTGAADMLHVGIGANSVNGPFG